MFDWQTVIAWGLILIAGLYMLRRVYRRFTGTSKVSSCGSCSAGRSKLEVRPLTQIQMPTSRKNH